MVKKLINKTLGYFDLELRRKRRTNIQKGAGSFPYKLGENPLDQDLHLELAKHSLKNNDPFLAFAEFKTAKFLGLNEATADEVNEVLSKSVPLLDEMKHNTYFRLNSLKEEIQLRMKENGLQSASVLDVGGGNGELASFIPSLAYCLAEPEINGISGLDLPFDDGSFDFVVSCHVLEHIPIKKRDLFLDQLVEKSKRGVILLNPIFVPGTFPIEKLQLVVDVTNVDWAKEHLDCTLPTVQEIQEYADTRGLDFHYKANGTLTTSLALVFLDHVSGTLPEEKYNKINKFFNQKFGHILNSEQAPTAGLFYLQKKSK